MNREVGWNLFFLLFSAEGPSIADLDIRGTCFFQHKLLYYTILYYIYMYYYRIFEVIFGWFKDWGIYMN